jgi:hypothetical protein
MSITSTKAFADIQVKLPERRREVYKAIAENPNSSIYDIADVLGWNLNQVSNRINELVNSGLVEKTGSEIHGKFERDLFSVITDKEKIIEKQRQLYKGFLSAKEDLEADYQNCKTENGRKILKNRIEYYKEKIRNLKWLI